MLIKTGKYFVLYHLLEDTEEGYIEHTFVVSDAYSFTGAEKAFWDEHPHLNASIHEIKAELNEG